jgi:penicillin G amidase
MNIERVPTSQRTTLRRTALAGLSLLAAVALGAGLWGYWQLYASLPMLEGNITAPGLSGPVTVVRDAHGVPTITGENRADLAWALGFVHTQERFFQMDGQRRTASGELSDLVGPAALNVDRRNRLHRFRGRAAAVLAAMHPEERTVLDAYVAGVNGGLAALRSVPFEYLVLRSKPDAWTAEDTMLTVYAMYLTLQEPDGETERWRANAIEVLGPALIHFLFPQGTSWDAPLDGSSLPTPEMPRVPVRRAAAPARDRSGGIEPLTPGSNGFAVSGSLTTHGSAIIANDLHLGLRVPNIWYRARLVVKAGAGSSGLDITGITLPGAPTVVAGSNGRVAWGFTNSYVDTSDLVVLEPLEESPNGYRTPHGPKELTSFDEQLCRKCSQTEIMTVHESVWGPIVGADAQGRKLAYRWIAHDPVAVGLSGALELERAATAREALAIAHRLGIPHQNLVAGDVDGNIGWTVTSALPRRFGHDGQRPTSWADGQAGWNGYLGPGEVPVVFNPELQRIWTANARVIGGEALNKLGFGGYAHGARASQIRDGLFKVRTFSEANLLAIQLDDRGALLERWQKLLSDALHARAHIPEFEPLVPEVQNWGGRAVPESVGYRLVRAFRFDLISRVYDAYTASVPAIEPLSGKKREHRHLRTSQADEPAWRLLTEKPAHFVPPGYRDWEAVIDAALSTLVAAIKTEAEGTVAAFTWGAFNRAEIRHPLTRALPALSWFLDPPDEPQHGDVYQPRVAAPGFGASVRFVVSPGHEVTGIFHMPTSQSDHPLAPYYNIGHDDWAKGRPAPFLPAQAKWQLTLQPGPAISR